MSLKQLNPQRFQNWLDASGFGSELEFWQSLSTLADGTLTDHMNDALSQKGYVGSPREKLRAFLNYDTGVHGTFSDMMNHFLNDSFVTGLSFDGDNDLVELPHRTPMIGAPFSVAVEFEIDTLPSTRAQTARIVAKKAGASPFDSWNIDVSTDNKVKFNVINSAGTSFTTTGDSALTTGRRYKAVCVLDGSFNTKLYIDGVEQADSDSPGSLFTTSPDVLRFGANSSTSNRLAGKIYDIKFWRSALSQAEVTEYINQKTPSINGLVASWNFKEGSGTNLNDVSDEALIIDGVDDVITISPSADVNFATKFSIEAIIQPNSVGENNLGRIADKNGSNDGYLFWINSPSGGSCKVSFQMYFSGTFLFSTISNYDIPFGKKTHIAVSYDETGDRKAHIYINGVLVAQSNTASTGNALDDSSNNFLIGNRTATDRTFDGNISEVHVYAGKALTQAEITDRFVGKFVDGVTASYVMNQGSGTSLKDNTGSNDGTITGASWKKNTYQSTISGATWL